MRRLLAVVVGVALGSAAAACGDDGGDRAPDAAGAAPEPPRTSPFIASLAVDPGDGTLMIGTGLGLYRLAAREKRASRVVGRLATPRGTGRVSSNLELAYLSAGDLVASGHPEGDGLPNDLGLIRSRDQGETWESVAALGEADFHIVERNADVLVGVPAEETRIMTSADGGRRFTESGTAPAPPTDLDVDPSDARRWVIATAGGTLTSPDGGGSWRRRDLVPGAHMAWVRRTALYRMLAGGATEISRDGGTTWEPRGSAGLTANALAADARGRLYAGLPDGIVKQSTDGGRTWRVLVRLP